MKKLEECIIVRGNNIKKVILYNEKGLTVVAQS